MVVALLWALLPLVPALASGELPGQPFTDLYPSVWGLDTFCAALPGLALHTTRVGAPAGIGFYYSSPIHGLVGWPVWAVAGPVAAYVVTLVLARAATVLAAYGYLQALGRSSTPALAGALVYGASPFFHGYTVEGIVEGTDGWALALWAWMVVARRPALAALAFALTVISSWYLGMVACLLAAGWGLRARTAWASAALGLVAAAPALWSFTHAFGGNSPLDPAVRVAMGAALTIPRPGLLPGLNPFAKTTFIGFAAAFLAFPSARRHPGWALGALACAVLSTGRGPWWSLPVLEMVRFPYRWHAGTLLCLAPLVAATVEGRRWAALGYLPFVEGLLCSPIEPLVPGAPTTLPSVYDEVHGGTLLEVPGPVALPPGRPNPSRPRARWLLFAQLRTGAVSPWTLDFNGISHDRDAPWLASFASWDPVVATEPLPPDVAGARAAGVTRVMVHRDELSKNADAFEAALLAAGARRLGEDGALVLYGL